MHAKNKRFSSAPEKISAQLCNRYVFETFKDLQGAQSNSLSLMRRSLTLRALAAHRNIIVLVLPILAYRVRDERPRGNKTYTIIQQQRALFRCWRGHPRLIRRRRDHYVCARRICRESIKSATLLLSAGSDVLPAVLIFYPRSQRHEAAAERVCESKHAAPRIRHTNEKLSRPAQKEAAISRWGPKVIRRRLNFSTHVHQH